jgi:hypothetical protein
MIGAENHVSPGVPLIVKFTVLLHNLLATRSVAYTEVSMVVTYRRLGQQLMIDGNIGVADVFRPYPRGPTGA